MARPKKRKLDVAETMAEDGAGDDTSSSTTGTQHSALEPSSPAAHTERHEEARMSPKFRKACEEYQEAQLRAESARQVSKEWMDKLALAQRLHDAKMRRLDAGDKLKRRKKPIAALRRGYEAMLELMSVRWQCEVSKRICAEKETAAAKAELRMVERCL